MIELSCHNVWHTGSSLCCNAFRVISWVTFSSDSPKRWIQQQRWCLTGFCFLILYFLPSRIHGIPTCETNFCGYERGGGSLWINIQSVATIIMCGSSWLWWVGQRLFTSLSFPVLSSCFKEPGRHWPVGSCPCLVPLKPSCMKWYPLPSSTSAAPISKGILIFISQHSLTIPYIHAPPVSPSMSLRASSSLSALWNGLDGRQDSDHYK